MGKLQLQWINRLHCSVAKAIYQIINQFALVFIVQTNFSDLNCYACLSFKHEKRYFMPVANSLIIAIRVVRNFILLLRAIERSIYRTLPVNCDEMYIYECWQCTRKESICIRADLRLCVPTTVMFHFSFSITFLVYRVKMNRHWLMATLFKSIGIPFLACTVDCIKQPADSVILFIHCYSSSNLKIKLTGKRCVYVSKQKIA